MLIYAFWCLQVGRGVNRFAQAIRLAVIMQEVEQTDNLAGLESTATPSWIRALFRSGPTCTVINPIFFSIRLARNKYLNFFDWRKI